MSTTIVHEWFQHKFFFFFFCQSFEKLFMTCAKKFINYYKIVDLQVFNHQFGTADLKNLRAENFKSHKHNRNVFIIFYNH